MHDHHQPRVVVDPALHDALHRDLVVAQHLGDLGEDAGAVGDLQVQVEGGGDVGDDRQLLACLVDRRLAGQDRDDVPQHRGGGLDAAGPRPRHRHLGDRRRLDHHRVEGTADRRQRVAAVEEAGEDANADPALVALGDPEQLQREAQLLGVGEVVGLDLLDPLVGDLAQRHRGVEGEAGEDRHLRRGVGAVDVVGRVGLRVAQLLGAGQHVPVGGAGRRHLAEDEVGGAVDDAEDLGDLGRAEALLDHADDRDHPGHRRLEAKLNARLAGDAEQLLAVPGEQLLVGGDDRPPRSQRVQHVGTRRVCPADQLDDQVGAPEDLAEVALAAGQRPGQLRPPAARRLDGAGPLGEQLGEGTTDRAVPQQPDANRVRRHRGR